MIARLDTAWPRPSGLACSTVVKVARVFVRRTVSRMSYFARSSRCR